MTDRAAHLRAAIAKNKGYLKEKDALAYHNKIEKYQAELDALEADQSPVVVEWSKLSDDPSYAIQQLVALAGVEDTDPSDNANIDSDALNAAVADQQDIRDALVVLGTLPRSASPAVFDAYFDVTPVPGSQDGSENIQPKPEFDRTGVWAAFRASKL